MKPVSLVEDFFKWMYLYIGIAGTVITFFSLPWPWRLVVPPLILGLSIILGLITACRKQRHTYESEINRLTQELNSLRTKPFTEAQKGFVQEKLATLTDEQREILRLLLKKVRTTLDDLQKDTGLAEADFRYRWSKIEESNLVEKKDDLTYPTNIIS